MRRLLILSLCLLQKKLQVVISQVLNCDMINEIVKKFVVIPIEVSASSCAT